MDLSAAAGASDDNFASSPGNAANSRAIFAGEIFVILILSAQLQIPQFLLRRADLGQEPFVLTAAAGNVPREHAQQHHKPQKAIHKAQDAAHHRDQRQRQGDQVQRQDQHAQRPIELVVAIAAIHKAQQCISYSVQKSHSLFLFLLSIQRRCAAGDINFLSHGMIMDFSSGVNRKFVNFFLHPPLLCKGLVLVIGRLLCYNVDRAQ